MTTYAFRIVNVFTVGDDRFSGNPLCVFENAEGLDEAQMQQLARQFNLSETTFVLPPMTDAGDARVRIFTPGFEMPFAGHPTLGTAHVFGKERVRFEMKAGVVPVSFADGAWTLRAAKVPAVRAVGASRAELAAMLSLPADAVSDEPLWIDTGSEQLVIPLASADLVRAAKPVPALLERWGYTAAREEAMAYVWARGVAEWLVRFFFTSHGAVIEDPATGSACANLGGWHLARNAPLPLAATLLQGAQVGRPSRLSLRVDADRSIHVSGAVIDLGRGTIEL